MKDTKIEKASLLGRRRKESKTKACAGPKLAFHARIQDLVERQLLCS